MFLLGGLLLPFDSKTTTIVKRFVSTAVGKIYKIRSNNLHDLEGPIACYHCKLPYFISFYLRFVN